MPPSISAWPGGAHVAVMVTVMYETWPEGKAPPYSPMASALREGVVDRQGISWAEYGGRTGIWTLARILRDFDIKATVCANARAAERYPDSIRALVGGGHEIAGHSYTQNMFLPYLEPTEEQALIRRCTAILTDVAGAKPVGWASPRMTPTEHTARFLAEDGYLWHGDYNDTDLPYVVETGAGPVVALMHSDFTDNRVMRGSPRDFLDVYRDTYDYLRGTGRPEILNLTLHAHFGGRPPMAAAFSQILRHIQASGGAWFARHDELARWVLDQGATP
ncbi:polysaccharide deacetylase family protein [Plastoroseomonas hellenica]|uniref:polysaccharide deacetylase family protein n=1 Tax=Plastoroseomonas hellenica TaxID=2687306 RepID=UPI001BAB647D|nr:polysaccharide deacetylase family protein [Plastoroseomonas hellenica]MBR0646673.1 polysaccharide deacetylase family protein [Plastoroseomonas hellenica]